MLISPSADLYINFYLQAKRGSCNLSCYLDIFYRKACAGFFNHTEVCSFWHYKCVNSSWYKYESQKSMVQLSASEKKSSLSLRKMWFGASIRWGRNFLAMPFCLKMFIHWYQTSWCQKIISLYFWLLKMKIKKIEKSNIFYMKISSLNWHVIF